MSDLLFYSRFISKTSTSLFAGAAIYCNLVEHAARLSCGTRLSATVFPPSYKRAAILQGTLASIGCTSALVSYYLKPEKEWLIAGLLIGSVVPFTFICIMPTNKKLLDKNVDKDAESTKQLLIKWGYLHGIRSTASFISMLIMLYQG